MYPFSDTFICIFEVFHQKLSNLLNKYKSQKTKQQVKKTKNYPHKQANFHAQRIIIIMQRHYNSWFGMWGWVQWGYFLHQVGLAVLMWNFHVQ